MSSCITKTVKKTALYTLIGQGLAAPAVAANTGFMHRQTPKESKTQNIVVQLQDLAKRMKREEKARRKAEEKAKSKAEEKAKRKAEEEARLQLAAEQENEESMSKAQEAAPEANPKAKELGKILFNFVNNCKTALIKFYAEPEAERQPENERQPASEKKVQKPKDDMDLNDLCNKYKKRHESHFGHAFGRFRW